MTITDVTRLLLRCVHASVVAHRVPVPALWVSTTLCTLQVPFQLSVMDGTYKFLVGLRC